MGHQSEIEFNDFRVIKARQFFKYNVKKDPIFEIVTLMGTHQVKEVGGATSYDPSKSQLFFSLQS